MKEKKSCSVHIFSECVLFGASVVFSVHLSLNINWVARWTSAGCCVLLLLVVFRVFYSPFFSFLIFDFFRCFFLCRFINCHLREYICTYKIQMFSARRPPTALWTLDNIIFMLVLFRRFLYTLCAHNIKNRFFAQSASGFGI